MVQVRSDNERLMREQERILKSLSDRQNQHTAQLIPERDTEKRVNSDNKLMINQKEAIPSKVNEAKSRNFSDKQEMKKQKVDRKGKFRKIKPPTIDGEVEEVAEAWIINMKKCFQVYEYNSKLKAHLVIYQLWEKTTLWWEEVKNVRRIEDQNVTWDKFQQYFKYKYLTE